MDREKAIQEIREQWRILLPTMTQPAQKKVNGEASYICPFCPHGTHGDGISYNPKSKDKNSLHCFSCGFSGDIIDIYMKLNNCDFNTALAALANDLNLIIDDPHKENYPEAKKTPQNGNLQPGKRDYRNYYEECIARIEDPAAVSYLQGRGISIETAKKAFLGYDPQADPSGKGFKAPRIIIPTSRYHYVGRSIDPNTPKRYEKLNPAGSSPGIFNEYMLFDKEAQEVFVCEGAFDALSLMEVGAAAISVNSASNAEALINTLAKKKTNATLLLVMDNDNAGNAAAEVLKQGLLRLNIPFAAADICGSCKDPNEALIKNRIAFSEAVAGAILKAAKPFNTLQYIEQDMKKDIADFKTDIKTGFKNLDEETGGLYPGFYILAATSSTGKTTFALQLADQIAASGKEVLFFSLEQSRLELVSKSFSRIAAQKRLDTTIDAKCIMRDNLVLMKDHLELEAAQNAYINLVADRVSIIEGNFNCNIDYVCNCVRKYKSRNNVAPVVFIDYVQILQPSFDDKRSHTTKEGVDNIVTTLKRLSRELKIPIIGIASMNRASYLTSFNMEGLKESGSLEFTADVLLGLQMQVVEHEFYGQLEAPQKRLIIKRERKKRPRKLDLVCIKNRYGNDFTCSFDYYSRNDLFLPGKSGKFTEYQSLSELDDDAISIDVDTIKKAKRGAKKKTAFDKWIQSVREARKVKEEAAASTDTEENPF